MLLVCQGAAALMVEVIHRLKGRWMDELIPVAKKGTDTVQSGIEWLLVLIGSVPEM